MSRTVRIVFWTLGILFVGIVVVALLPSLLGLLMVLLLVFALVDLLARRYRLSVRTLNVSLRAVCEHDGAIENVAIAFSRSGPLGGSCYEFARRLLAGEEAVSAAVSSRVPLQLSTAIALTSAGQREQFKPDSKTPDSQTKIGASASRVARELAMLESMSMPVNGQLVYLMSTAFLTCLVLAFMGTFIVPTIKTMFDEFDVILPLRAVFDAAPVVWLLVLLGLLSTVGVLILNRMRWFGLRLPRWVPLTSSMAERRADMLVGLADGLDAGWPLGRTMALGHAISRSGLERRSLESAMRLVQKGIQPLEAIQQIGWLDASEGAWLSNTSAERAGELLRSFAAQSVRDARENARWIMAILFPVVVIGMGAIVMLYAAAFFGALAELTHGLS